MLSKLHLSNNISIIKDENPHLVVRELKQRYTHENPRYYRNLNLGFSTFGIPKVISLLTEHQDHIELPRGLAGDLVRWNPDAEIIDNTTLHAVNFIPSKIILKPYQQEALNKLMEKNQGVLVAPPATGKTIIAIELIMKRNQKSLILVHSKELLHQWIERLQQFTDSTPGRINGNCYDIKPITIGMVQALSRPLEMDFLNQFGLVLLDEAHHCPAYTFQNLLCQFPARFRYGFTATPERQDGLTFFLHAVLGNTIHEVSKNHLFLSGAILKPTIKAFHTNFYRPSVTDYATLLQAVTQDQERNNIIIQNVKEESEAGHYCLVLSERISHAIRLYKMFKEQSQAPAICITGTHTQQERSKGLKGVREGSIYVIFATKIADEGLDVERLDRLFLTCPIRATNKLTQQIGRIMRVFPGKKDCIVFDFVDSLTSLANSQYFTRREKVYRHYELQEIAYEAHHGH